MQMPYLYSVANIGDVKFLLTETLHELVGATDKRKPISDHTVVGFSDSSALTGRYISKLARAIGDAMYAKGLSLARAKFKDFKEDTTKLTPEVINEMWLEAARVIREELYSSFEVEEGHVVPGLEESLKEGAIIPKERSAFPEAVDSAREDMQKRARDIDKELLLQIFRNKFFEHLRKNFGLFQEQNEESTLELKPRMR